MLNDLLSIYPCVHNSVWTVFQLHFHFGSNFRRNSWDGVRYDIWKLFLPPVFVVKQLVGIFENGNDCTWQGNGRRWRERITVTTRIQKSSNFTHRALTVNENPPGRRSVSPHTWAIASALHSQMPTFMVRPAWVTSRRQKWKHRKSVKCWKPASVQAHKYKGGHRKEYKTNKRWNKNTPSVLAASFKYGSMDWLQLINFFNTSTSLIPR